MKTLKIVATVVFFLFGIGFLLITQQLPEGAKPLGWIMTIGAGLGFIGAGIATTREMLKGNFS